MSAPNPENMSREELLESLRCAEMQRNAVDDLIRKQQDLIQLMTQKMDKLSEMSTAEAQSEMSSAEAQSEEASDASTPAEDNSDP